jgi:hypothetical protein
MAAGTTAEPGVLNSDVEPTQEHDEDFWLPDDIMSHMSKFQTCIHDVVVSLLLITFIIYILFCSMQTSQSTMNINLFLVT